MTKRDQRSPTGTAKRPPAALVLVWLLLAVVGQAGPGRSEATSTGDVVRPVGSGTALLGLFPGESELGGPGEQAAIRRLYTALEEAVRSSGFTVAFELDDFRSYRPGDFPETLLLDVLTIRPPLELQILELEVGGAEGPVGRSFEPSWREGVSPEERESVEEWMAQFEGMTLADVYADPATDADHRDIAALTSYRVRAEFDGRSTSYRAIVKWVRRPEQPAQELALLIEDPVTDNVHRAILAGEDVQPVSVLQSRALERPVGDAQ